MNGLDAGFVVRWRAAKKNNQLSRQVQGKFSKAGRMSSHRAHGRIDPFLDGFGLRLDSSEVRACRPPSHGHGRRVGRATFAVLNHSRSNVRAAPPRSRAGFGEPDAQVCACRSVSRKFQLSGVNRLTGENPEIGRQTGRAARPLAASYPRPGRGNLSARRCGFGLSQNPPGRAQSRSGQERA